MLTHLPHSLLSTTENVNGFGYFCTMRSELITVLMSMHNLLTYSTNKL